MVDSLKKAPPGLRKAALAFAILGLIALGFSAYKGRQRYLRENPPPLPEVIAPIPPEQREMVKTGMALLSKTLLQCTPEQEKQIAEIWSKTPRSVNEVIEFQRKTDQILTPEQREKLKPIRKRFQDRIVDKMIEPARDRFPEEDFEKFSKEIKDRVENRISGGAQ